MPIYEYICSDCSQHFELLVRGTGNVECPGCKSTKLQKQLSVFAANVGGSQAAPAMAAGGGCMSCGDPRGPGSCSLN